MDQLDKRIAGLLLDIAAEEAAEAAKKKLCKKLGKKAGGAILRKVPVIAIGFFIWDAYEGGVGHATNELLWPLSEAWSGASPGA